MPTKLQLTSPDGGTLNTAGKYCENDIEVIPKLQDKTVTENGTVSTDEGYAGLGTVTVNVDGTTLNIAYGDTAPSDTSKLWVKTAEPTNVSLTPNVEGVESIDLLGYQMPTAKSYNSSVSIGTKIYDFTGSDASGYTNEINVIDTETGTVRKLSASIPSAGTAFGVAAVGTKIYLFGGYSDKIYAFDTESEEVETLTTSIGSKTAAVMCESYDGKVYLFGGTYNSGYTSSIRIFYTDTEQLYTLPNTLPKAMASSACARVGTKVYLFCGNTQKGNTVEFLNSIIVYDILENTATTLSTVMPFGGSGVKACAVGSKIYLFGGYGFTPDDNGYRYRDDIYVFDTETEEVTKLSTKLLYSLSDMGCALIGNEIYLLAGAPSASAKTNGILKFTLTFPLATGDIQIQTGLVENTFSLIASNTATLETGVKSVYVGNADGVAERAEAYLYNGTEWAPIS